MDHKEIENWLRLRKEFNDLGDRMFEIYHMAPQNGSKRKIIGCCDDKGNILIFFQGNMEDGFAVQKFLNARKKNG